MANHLKYNQLLNDYKSLTWQNRDVFTYYERLHRYLMRKLGEEIAQLFAKPDITDEALKGQTEGSWKATWLTSDAQPITNLEAEEQEAAKQVLAVQLERLHEYTQKLAKSSDVEDQKWGELIDQALVIPDESHIFTEDGQFTLVAWGFRLEKTFDLKKSLPNTKENADVDIKTPLPATESSSTSETQKDEEPTEISEATTTPTPPADSDPKPQGTDSAPSNSEKTETNESITTQANKDEAKPTEPKQPWWKRLWWLWLLLLLCLVLMLSLRQCKPKENNPLPSQPGKLVPIDSSKITEDPQKAKVIASDRLNVALTGPNNNIPAFAKAFKAAYPRSNFKIIYYDTLTHRLQLQIPTNEREKVKKELPQKLKAFKMLIWYEGIFQRNFRYEPNDPGFQNLKQSWYHTKIKVQEAWDVTRGDTGLVVAVIDDGFDLSHPEFRGKVYRPWNVVTASPAVNTGRKSTHGTHVAGIAIGVADNGQGVSGIAPNCKFMPIQVGDFNGQLTSTAIIDGILYAINNGADVVNISLGLVMPTRVTKLPPQTQREIIANYYKDEEAFWNELFKNAYDKNIVVVLAGGNQNVMIGLDPMQRSPHTVKVSAVDPRNNKASFSNYGDQSTLSAPGVDIYSSLPKNRYNYLSGTSMAAPVVTGSIALLKSANRAMSFPDIVDLLQSTGIPVNNRGSYVGNIIQLDQALGIAQKGREKVPKVDCPDAQRKIDDLLQQIEKIKQDCKREELTGDTLRIPTNPDFDKEDFGFAVGRWKSTTYIYSVEDGEKVTIYFDFFKNGTGKITLVEPNGRQCTADLSLALLSGQFNIDQLVSATCLPPPKGYNPYTFECKPDKNGYAECIAQNKKRAANRFKFKLVKIK
ncbi:MAG TPA: hypothetical protein DCS93_35995 [Microscillaceae bacterium]|nr:hypothetical protein [Microscillaceae bacterium]